MKTKIKMLVLMTLLIVSGATLAGCESADTKETASQLKNDLTELTKDKDTVKYDLVFNDQNIKTVPGTTEYPTNVTEIISFINGDKTQVINVPYTKKGKLPDGITLIQNVLTDDTQTPSVTITKTGAAAYTIKVERPPYSTYAQPTINGTVTSKDTVEGE